MRDRDVWKKAAVGVAVLVAFSLGASCGSTGDHPAGHAQDANGDGAPSGRVPGRPGNAADADTTIRVTASDSLRFDPPTLEVNKGDTVTFVVENAGADEHEFVLGDAQYHEEHAQEMGAGHGHMTASDNAIELDPGETEKLTWTFTEPGWVLFGCHEDGHYEGGMVGTIDVTT